MARVARSVPSASRTTTSLLVTRPQPASAGMTRATGSVAVTENRWSSTRRPPDMASTTTSLRTSLLRAPAYPDPVADRGQHVQRLALLVGADLDDATRAGHAARRALVPGAADDIAVPPVADASGPGVVVTAVKLADDGSGDLIVRLAEVCGARVQVPVRTALRITKAHACNLLEEPQRALDVADGFVNLTLRPFELVTLRLSFSG